MLSSCRHIRTLLRLNSISVLTCFGNRTARTRGFPKTFPFQFQRCIASKTTTTNNFRYYSSVASEDPASGKDNPNVDDAETSKKTRLVAVMVGSAVAFIGSSYILFGKMQKVKTEAVVPENVEVDVPVDKSTEEDEEDTKKKKKKHGFRERRV